MKLIKFITAILALMIVSVSCEKERKPGGKPIEVTPEIKVTPEILAPIMAKATIYQAVFRSPVKNSEFLVLRPVIQEIIKSNAK